MKYILSLFMLFIFCYCDAQTDLKTAFEQRSDSMALLGYLNKARAETEKMHRLLQFTGVQYDSVLSVNIDYYSRIGRLMTKQVQTARNEMQINDIENERKERLRFNLNATQYRTCMERLSEKKTRIETMRSSLEIKRATDRDSLRSENREKQSREEKLPNVIEKTIQKNE